MVSLNQNSKNRQVAEENNKDKGKSPSQTKGNRHETDAETQNKLDAKDANPMVMGNNNKESIVSFSEVSNNQNLITGAETKEDETTISMQNDCNSVDFLTESCIHHSSCIIEEEEDDMTAIGMQIDYNSVDFLEDSLISHNSPIFEEETKDTAAHNTTTNNNNIESLIVGIRTDIGKQAQTTQNKKRK